LLSEKVSFDDVPTIDKAGAIKIGQFNVGVSDGNLYAQNRNYQQYQQDSNNVFISKGTLENAITGKELVNKSVNNLTNYTTTSDMNTLLNAKENTSNKVVSISSSSTDTQYPSAKCVYDLVGDVETLLTTLDIGGGI
jgi:capsular polysaccharide biosynthesis protein